MTAASIVLVALSTLVVLLGWAYFRRYTLTRPPVGVVDLSDVIFMVAAIVVVPYLYLGLPELLVALLLAVSTLSAIWFLLEPVLPSRRLVWALSVAMVAADVILAEWRGTADHTFLLFNDLVLILLVVGVTNLWAQGGLSSRDLAILAGALTVYDAVATGWLPLTTELIERLAGLPFLPMLVWPVGDERWLGIGLGDLLLATVGPLTFRKAFGRTAGVMAFVIAVGTIAAVMFLGTFTRLETFPTMIVLGPLLVAQHLVWRRRAAERTTAEYLIADPIHRIPRLVSQYA
jgi:hypothetical protein